MIIEMSDDIFVENIVALRKKYHMSRKTLALLINIPESLLKRIEEGTLAPALPLESLYRIPRIFNIETNDLVRVRLKPFL